MLTRWFFSVLILWLVAAVAAAELNVVTTTSSMSMLAREVGGDQVKVTVLVAPNRDAHQLRAKPSMMQKVRRADLLIAIGAELEVGWLPNIIDQAGNSGIRPGRDGYFEAAAQVSLIDTGQPADRALGDLHPMGNPHVNMDPERMAIIGQALAQQMGKLDPANAANFRARADTFASAVAARMPGWRAQTKDAPGAVLYHKSADYLLQSLGVPILGFIEPMPGIPPTAKHLRRLVDNLQDQRGVILYHNYNSPNGPDFLARELGWTSHALPLEPPLQASAQDYLDLINDYVLALAAAK
jgi:zinc/manganese transport system substrate-binding protein